MAQPRPAAGLPAEVTVEALKGMLAEAIESTTAGMRNSIVAVTRESTSIKASQVRLEAQRRLVNDIGKTEGKTVSLAKQLDSTSSRT